MKEASLFKPYKNQFILVLTTIFLSTFATAETDLKRRICIFDFAGGSGPIFNAAKEIRVAALEWGNYEIELVPYINESVLAEDFRTGSCDGATLIGIRARSFLKFTGSIDSPGGLPDMDHFKMLVKVLSHPSYADKVHNDVYELAGIAPIGTAYVFVRDKTINNLAKAAGKKVAVLEFDKTQAKIAIQVGATPVPSSIINFAKKFNNGAVDIIIAPAAAYSAFELYRGLEPDGAIIRYPLTILTAQLLVNRKRFDPHFTQKAREYSYSSFDRIVEIVEKEVAQIDDKYWVDIPKEDVAKYEALMQQIRIQLRDSGDFDGEMMKLLRKIRCKKDRSRAECFQVVE